jgi:hypothetical protein
MNQMSTSNEGKKIYDTAFQSLSEIGPFALQVSKAFRGKPADRRGQLASVVFGKICTHARSVVTLTESIMFDHSAIIAVSRMVVEGMTMFFYLRQEVNDEMWALRDLVLRLHVTTTQVMGMRSHKPKEAYKEYEDGKKALIKQIKTHPLYRTFGPEQQERMIRGGEIFIGGMRRAAMQTGAWTEEMFVGTYAYLSSHAHSAPLSFFNIQRVGVNPHNPVDYQYGLAGFGIEITAGCLRRTTLRFLDDCLEMHPEMADEFSKPFVDAQREHDNHYGILFDAGAEAGNSTAL